MHTEHVLFSIKIGAQTVQVVYDPDMEDFGEYTASPRPKIHLGTCVSPTLELTVLHEVLHCIDDQYEIGLSEQGIRILEQSLACIVHDNPELTLGWVKRITKPCPSTAPTNSPAPQDRPSRFDRPNCGESTHAKPQDPLS